MAHQYMPKIFHDPNKTPAGPPPAYLMYSPLIHFMVPVTYSLQVLLLITFFLKEEGSLQVSFES